MGCGEVVGGRLIILMAIISLVAFEGAHACSPVPGYSSDPVKLRDLADEVFIGKVTSVGVDESARLVTAKLRVTRVWKGPLARARTVATVTDESACGLGSGFFVKGRRYLVYARKYAGVRWVSLVDGTKDRAHAASDIKHLGAGVVVP